MIPVTMALLLGCSGSGGVIAGCLIRQPEINRLRKKVKQLNGRNSELRKMLNQQMQVIDSLQNEIRAYKFINFIQRRRTRLELRKNLAVQYACKEYLELLIAKDKEEKLNDVQQEFFNTMDRCLNEKEITEEEKEYIDSYVLDKYKEDIKRCKKWDYHELIA